MAFLAFLGPGRSGLSLRMAVVAWVALALLIVLFSTDSADSVLPGPLSNWAFPANAVLFHAGLAVALWARLGNPAKRGTHTTLAITANLVPVAAFWFFAFAILQALNG